MDMTATEWWSAIGQTLFVIGISFVVLCIATSWVRFQMLTETARESEELGLGEDKAFRLSVLNQTAVARRQRRPFSVLLLRLPESGPPRADVEASLRSLLRSADKVIACGDRLLGIMAQCGSEKSPQLVKRLVTEATSAGVVGTEMWRVGVSGFPEHGLKTSALYPRALQMLEDAEQRNVLIAGMADPEAVAEAKSGEPDLVDELTGLIHEEKMIGVMRRYIAQERRAERPVSMMYVMVDQIERMTEVHGPNTTKAMIKELAEKLSKTTRETDMLARFGAGGFVMAMPVSPAEAMAVAQRLVQDVRKHAFTAGSGLKVSISAGVAGYPDVVGSAVQYFVAAEAALLQARLRGRSQCLPYDRSMIMRTENEVTPQHL